MQVSNEQLTSCGPPERFLAKKYEFLGVPAPVVALARGDGLWNLRVPALLSRVSGMPDGQCGE